MHIIYYIILYIYSLYPDDIKEVSCLSDPCGVSSCPIHFNSVCVFSSCGQCSTYYYIYEYN